VNRSNMKFVLCVLALTSVVSATWERYQFDVKVTYDAPTLSFTLKTTSTEKIGGVVFKYKTQSGFSKAKALSTSEGWMYQTKQSLTQSDSVLVYAHVYDVDGQMRIITDPSTYTLSSALASHSQLPSRQIRAAVIFRDDFNSFDRNSWNTEVSMYGGMNWEFQVYTNDQKNVFTKNGMLYLQPTFTVDDPRFSAPGFLHNGQMDMSTLFGTCTESHNYGCSREGKYGLLPPVMSGKVKSIPTLKFGTVEVRARIPRGDWLWPAIWMLPKDNKYGGWPRSGEIDIMESRGNPGDLGVNAVSSTLHWGTAWNVNKYGLTTGDKKMNPGAWSDDFHTWRLDWTREHINTYVDNQLVNSVTPQGSFWQWGGFSGSNIWGSNNMAPFDQEFYAIFNVAVGGTNGFFPESMKSTNGAAKPWKNDSPQAAQDFWDRRSEWQSTWQGDKAAMIIDYIEFRSL